MLISIIAVFGFSVFSAAASKSCKCIPDDVCWPSKSKWKALNTSVSGNLIATQPIAISCYPGSAQNAATCAFVVAQWTNSSFQAESSVGLDYPIDVTCPPINTTAGETPGTCTIGSNPRYAVKATEVAHVVSAVNFAKQNNVRLVIKDTGHDILGRSDGYGALEIWIRHLRTGLTFENSHCSSCKKTNWTGSAFKIGGGYTWADVYPTAAANNVVVVGGGTPSVGCLGGWMQGGGHGPPSREFGLGADQVLEAQVVLANGSIVTANACQNTDIFFGIRGGGPGTYGVVTSTTIKAHPMVSVAVQHLAIAPLTTNTSALLDAVSILYGAYPDLNDAGYAGYGTWTIASPTPLFGNFTAGYVHGFYIFNHSEATAQDAFAPVLHKLLPYNMTSLFISVSYVSYPDYWTFYSHESGDEPPVGSSSALGSRLFSRASVQRNATELREMMGVIAGTPSEYTSNNFELVSGGQVFADASDPYSGVNPVWRRAYFNSIVARGWAPEANATTVASVYEDITYTKVRAMKQQAPNTGAYMNEADRLDLNWPVEFYGTHYPRLLGIKQAHDPKGVFYCPTCVGSAEWIEDESGRLCRTRS